MSLIAVRAVFPIRFPAGICPGAGKDGNRITLARDGQGRWVLRGTALAGALRHAMARLHRVELLDPAIVRWFGEALDEDRQGASALRVADVVLHTGQANGSEWRTHIARSRHTGAVLPKSTFALEALPPGTRGTAVLVLKCDESDSKDAAAFFGEIAALFSSGMVLGGNGARGIGRAASDGNGLVRTFRLGDADDHAAWLDELYAWRSGTVPTTGRAPEAGTLTDERVLTVQLVLAVPRGQDVLVGGGLEVDHEMEPQQVRDDKGHGLWRIPGSSLRGALRAWVSRLAARDGFGVADSLERHSENPGADGDDLAWGFRTTKERERIVERLKENAGALEKEIACPVMKLFGSGYSAGRVHVSDAFSTDGTLQSRMHVAVDRITGGANDGFLFDCGVLHGARFELAMTVWDPSENEAKWLARSLAAVDVGICRVGSSKAGGRLGFVGRPQATGPFAEMFNSLKPSEA